MCDTGTFIYLKYTTYNKHNITISIYYLNWQLKVSEVTLPSFILLYMCIQIHDITELKMPHIYIIYSLISNSYLKPEPK